VDALSAQRSTGVNIGEVRGSLSGLGRPVVYYPSLNAITGSVTATIFLANLFQWSSAQRDFDGWIYKTQEEIEAETGLSRREQETARKQLRSAALLKEERRGCPRVCAIRSRLRCSMRRGRDSGKQGWRNAPNWTGVFRQTISTGERSEGNAG
jgi:hypothetical protein